MTTVQLTEQSNLPFLAPLVETDKAATSGLLSLQCILSGYRSEVVIEPNDIVNKTDLSATIDIHSFERLAEQASALGIETEQVLLPPDLIWPSMAANLPVIAMTTSPKEDSPKFVVVWNRNGPVVQVMDPQKGRRWTDKGGLHKALLRESILISEGEFANSQAFHEALHQRLSKLEINPDEFLPCASSIDKEVEGTETEADLDGYNVALLDATARMVTEMVQHGDVRKGADATLLLRRLLAQAKSTPLDRPQTVHRRHWSIEREEIGHFSCQVAGYLRIKGYTKPTIENTDEISVDEADEIVSESQHDESKEWVDTQEEMTDSAEEIDPPKKPPTTLLGYLKEDGLLSLSVVGAAMLLAGVGLFFQTILFKGLIQLAEKLMAQELLVGMIAVIVGFIVTLFMLNGLTNNAVSRLGQRTDIRLRIALLTLLPNLSSQHFQRFSAAQAIERIHSVRSVRDLPNYGQNVILSASQLLFTVIGLIWLDWVSALLAALRLVSTIVSVGGASALTAAGQKKNRDYLGVMSRFYRDAMQGLTAVQTHGAERAARREYEGTVTAWAANKKKLDQADFWSWVGDGSFSYIVIALIIISYALRHDDPANLLLLAYWAFNLDLLGQQVLMLSFFYIQDQSKIPQFLELLDAPKEDELFPVGEENHQGEQEKQGVHLTICDASVEIADQIVLKDIDVEIEAGSHVAIVGPSGAGKSTLIGLILGQHLPATGELLINKAPLSYEVLKQLRKETAWVDPSIQLWNRSLLYNLHYGGKKVPLNMVIQQADLRNILSRMPDGMQTRLGGDGRLVSGGEGQRVRFGRAMQAQHARLAILDEPFRGLDREKRQVLLKRARAFWSKATLICVTHDVGQTQTFERVLVIEDGRIIEDDSPQVLLAQPTSRYRALVDAEEAVRNQLWTSGEWRHLWLENGELQELSNESTMS